MSFGLGMLGGLVNTFAQTDYPATSPFGLWRDDYDRRARQGESKYYAYNHPSWVVAGAKKAGVHPNVLFGGPGGGFQAGTNTPQARPTGGGATPPRAQSAMDQRLGVLAIERAELENEALAASIAGRQAQGQPVGNPDGSITYQRGTVPGTGTEQLPNPNVRVEPHVQSPLRQKLYDEKGRELWVYSESAQADEINQAILAYQDARNQWREYVQAYPNAQSRKEQEWRRHRKRQLWEQKKQIERRVNAIRSNASRRAGAVRRSDEKRRSTRERAYQKSMGTGTPEQRMRASQRRRYGSVYGGQ